jgi:hypothetical protein
VCEILSILVQSILASTMKISDETKKELIKIGAEFSIKDGKERTLEDIVRLLIEEHRK